MHDLIDLPSGVVLATCATRAQSDAERAAALHLLDVVVNEHLVPRRIETLAADKGYATVDFLGDLLDRGVKPMIPMRKPELEPMPTWKRKPRTLVEARVRKRRRREVETRNYVRQLNETTEYRWAHENRTRVEHCFAEAKEWHGLGRARSVGLEKMHIQAVMTAVEQNVKHLVRFLRRRAPKAQVAALPPRPLVLGQPWVLGPVGPRLTPMTSSQRF